MAYLRRLLRFIRRHGYLILAFIALFTVGSFLRACYYAGQVKEALDTTRPLTKHQQDKLQKEATVWKQKAVVAEAKADSALATASVHEEQAVVSKHQADSLITRYHEIKLDTTATAAQLQHYLAHYVPGPEPDSL